MPPKRTKKEEESSDSDEGPVDRNPPPSKKSKTPSSNKEESESDTWTLEKLRKVTIREFKGKVMVDIREHYLDASGEMKPGKKGISLSATQFNKLADLIPEIKEKLKKY
ncbi:RNA polymerase II transcriptional coactivator-like [Ctenocephalides felis]|uniref:RNA polymerase II transcriptional coactivator-like n=1 Tax=Ctenocephalides felis TaxID=7515 RepID=UPI000E6E3E70|nr:RNA polymerase II transcriptional coactivator-like isoform X2 [Ctenocephalides felis]XP_026478904.1 RNA polymerase II transcriptional coactivator-like [Ctenocephalides felis]